MMEKMSRGKEGRGEYEAHVAQEMFTKPEERQRARELLKEHGLEKMTIEKKEDIEGHIANTVIGSLSKGKMKEDAFLQLLGDIWKLAENYNKKGMKDEEIQTKLVQYAQSQGAERFQ